MMSAVSCGKFTSQGQRSCSSATAPETSGAAKEVPICRVRPPWPSDTRISSPGATTKRSISRLPGRQRLSSVRQAAPGRLVKLEMLPSTSTEPTTRMAGFSGSHSTFLVWVTPSLPAATTNTVFFRVSMTLRLVKTLFQPGSKVEPGTPRLMLTTSAPLAFRFWTPRVTSSQSAVPVESKGLKATTLAIGAMPITPLPSCAPTISEPTAAPWPSVNSETPP